MTEKIVGGVRQQSTATTPQKCRRKSKVCTLSLLLPTLVKATERADKEWEKTLSFRVKNWRRWHGVWREAPFGTGRCTWQRLP